ncbi:MAG TPA: hypothetical protein P5150_08675 [Candidatus Ratteibacteria bacterium]|nr:hypothetical protein [Candidatus Ratteibacteria bacterium]
MRKLPDEFKKLKKIKEPFKRRLYFVAILTKYLKKEKIKPIIVGGNAVEFYTLGSYATGDIDIVISVPEMVINLLLQWNFKKIGRVWVNENLDIELDIVSDILSGDISKVSEVIIDDLKVYIEGIEDIIIDRLNAALWWKSDEDKKWAIFLLKLYKEKLDKKYLQEQAKKEGLIEFLKEIENEEI